MNDPDDRAPVRLARTVLYESPWVNLYRDRVALPTGRILEQYHFLDLGHAVVVIVQDRSNASSWSAWHGIRRAQRPGNCRPAASSWAKPRWRRPGAKCSKKPAMKQQAMRKSTSIIH